MTRRASKSTSRHTRRALCRASMASWLFYIVLSQSFAWTAKVISAPVAQARCRARVTNDLLAFGEPKKKKKKGPVVETTWLSASDLGQGKKGSEPSRGNKPTSTVNSNRRMRSITIADISFPGTPTLPKKFSSSQYALVAATVVCTAPAFAALSPRPREFEHLRREPEVFTNPLCHGLLAALYQNKKKNYEKEKEKKRYPQK